MRHEFATEMAQLLVEARAVLTSSPSRELDDISYSIDEVLSCWTDLIAQMEGTPSREIGLPLIGAPLPEDHPDTQDPLVGLFTEARQVLDQTDTAGVLQPGAAIHAVELLMDMGIRTVARVLPMIRQAGGYDDREGLLRRSCLHMRQRFNGLYQVRLVEQTLADMRRSETTALEAAEQARRATAELGQAVLAGGYNKYAARQNVTAWAFTAAAVVTVVVTLAVSIYFFEAAGQRSTTAQAIHNVAQLAIGIGLAGFFARQGSRHRAVTVWSEVLELQLRTFSSYLADVEMPTVRDEIRLRFAAKAFNSSPDTTADSAAEINWSQQAISSLLEKK